MNWAADADEDNGWEGRRRFSAKSFEAHEDARLIVIPRLGGMEALEVRATELSDTCAEHKTPWKQLVLQRGKPGIELEKALEAVCQRWNKLDENKGLKWRVVVFGLDPFFSLCSGIWKGEQPDYWIRVEYLSDRLLQENLEFDRRKQNELPVAKHVE